MDRARPGTHARRKPGGASCYLGGEMGNVLAEPIERCAVSLTLGPEDEIARTRYRKDVDPSQLAQATLQFVSPHGGKSEFRYHDGDANVTIRGIESLGVEQARPDSPAGTQQPLDIRRSRYPSSARKPELRLRRRRTCWEAVPSDACALSSVAGRVSGGPTSSPSGRGIHVS